MTRKRRRLYAVVLGMLGLSTAVALALLAFQDNLVFFYTPSDLAARPVAAGRHLRIGGLVEVDSVKKMPNGLTVEFKITDLSATLPVVYTGILPDLFRPGQGVVAEGVLRGDGVFEARQVLAKHDENYMPPEVAEALKKSGRWNEGTKTEKAPK